MSCMDAERKQLTRKGFGDERVKDTIYKREDDECPLYQTKHLCLFLIFVQFGKKFSGDIRYPWFTQSDLNTNAMLPRWGDQMANDSASSHLYHPNSVTCSASQKHASLGVLKTNLGLPETTLKK